MSTNVNKKPKRRIKYRLSFIVLFALLSFVFAFTMYMKNDNDITLPGGILESNAAKATIAEADQNTPDASAVSTVLITTAKGKDMPNPVPQSERAGNDYLISCLFIGSTDLNGLFESDLVPNDNVLTDDSINSSNLGNLIVQRGKDDKTIKNIIMDEKLQYIYILLSPETALDTDSLTDFCQDIRSNSKKTQIYFISALPSASADAFNTSLLQFANDSSVHYLDFNTAVVGNDGNITKTYANASGGLNRAGYVFLSDYILDHIAKK